MALVFLALSACSMAGEWDAAGEDPTKRDSGEEGDSTGDTSGSALSLVISELMKDPDVVTDDFGEWFEVTNTGAADAQLEGLLVSGPGGDGFAVEGTLAVGAGDRVVFGVSADQGVNGGVTVDYAWPTGTLKLSNEGGTLTLSFGDTGVDAVSWDTLPDVKGHAIALDPGALDPAANDLAESWCAAAAAYGDGDFGTPGSANDACDASPPDRDGDGVADADDCAPDDDEVYAGAEESADDKDNDCDGWTDEHAPGAGDLVVTEIMDDPDPTDDETGEWFELQNVSRDPIELSGVELSDAHSDAATLTGGVIEAGAFYLLAASDDPALNDGLSPDAVFDRASFHLENDADEIILSFAGEVVDEVDYDGAFPEEKGKSRSVDPIGASATRNDDPDYWCKGDGDYGKDGNQGTPGAENDACN